MSAYTPQFMVQATIWNANSVLTNVHGPMLGVIKEQIVKTKVPKIDRFGPHYITKRQEQIATDYLRLPESVSFPRNPDGSYPRMLHTCWGRFKPCEYIPLCHEDSRADFEQKVLS